MKLGRDYRYKRKERERERERERGSPVIPIILCVPFPAVFVYPVSYY